MRIDVLDHGYVELVETWGSEERIIESARMSTGKGFLGWRDHKVGCVLAGDREVPPEQCASCDGGVSKDEKLLRFLYENRHDTPFEMAGMTIEVMAPIFVFREWHRHRTQCLVGSTEIRCIQSGGEAAYTRTIEDLYRLKHVGVVDHLGPRERLSEGRTKNGHSKNGTPVTRDRRLREVMKVERTRKLPSCQSRLLRVLDEQSMEFTSALMAEVWQAGVKEVWEIRTARGRIVRGSAAHRFMTVEGWKQLGELRAGERLASNGKVAAMKRPVPPSLRAGIGVWTTMMRSRIIQATDRCYVCGGKFSFSDLQLDHVVPVVLDLKKALDETNLKPICELCHRRKTNVEQGHRQTATRLGVCWDELIVDPVRIGEEMTYDIEMDGPNHNFVANGLVVHNSYNEMSARYTPLPDVNYIPTVERLMMNSKTNKQAGVAADAEELTSKVAAGWLMELHRAYQQAECAYQMGLAAGVPKEIARACLPVGRYSRMRASTDLRNWLAFLTLREAPSAQFEIRQFAHAVSSLIAEAFPRTHALYVERRSK